MTDKKAYPNFDDYISQFNPYNMDKWTTALRDIYSRMKYGLSRTEAFGAVTGKWNTVEVRNFKHWLRFYEEQAHMKYKTALHSYYENDRQPGYFLPVRREVPDPVVAPLPDPKMMQDAQDVQSQAKVSEEERRRFIELQRRKIIGRLHSARKLLTDDKGKMFAGEQWMKLMDALNELEKQFHTVNVLRTSSPIYADLIIRKASFLAAKGHSEPSAFLLKLAQGLSGGIPPDPTASIPQGGALGNNNPTLDDRPGIEKVLDAFNGDLGHNKEEEDELESLDCEIDELDSEDADSSDAGDGEFEIELPEEDNEELIVEAQMAPGMAPGMPPAPTSDQTLAPAKLPISEEPAPVPAPAPEEPEADLAPKNNPLDITDKEPLEVSDKEPVAQGRDFDSLIDAAFSNLKVVDIVSRLDELSRIFKNREIARQLSIVDMMMDRLGLSSFFPSLAEATRSALESNQYCLTRIDEVKSRLSGAMNAGGRSLHDMGQQHSIKNQMKDSTLDKSAPTPSEDPLVAKIQQNLQSQQEKDKLRKELRKKEEEKDLLEGGKPQPQVEGLEQDLGGKAAPPRSPPAASAPPASPIK